MYWTATILLGASLAQADTVEVPSGQNITYLETVQNQPGPSGLTYRFRFVAPAINRDTGTIGIDVAGSDMDHLCSQFAMQRLPLGGPVPSQIIISLSDRVVDFGVPSPEATQFFEAYRIEDGLCIWEGF